MSDEHRVPPRHRPAEPAEADGLGPEQREFARVIGRLLAQRWLREGRGREGLSSPPAGGPAPGRIGPGAIRGDGLSASADGRGPPADL
jgi:hypothetical protein